MQIVFISRKAFNKGTDERQSNPKLNFKRVNGNDV